MPLMPSMCRKFGYNINNLRSPDRSPRPSLIASIGYGILTTVYPRDRFAVVARQQLRVDQMVVTLPMSAIYMCEDLPIKPPLRRTAREETLRQWRAQASFTPKSLHPAQTLERLQAISEYDILDTPAEPAFDSIARLAAEICDTQMAAISLVCEDRQWFKAAHGLDVRETPIEQSFCAHAIDNPDIFVITDAASHAAFCTNELVSGSFGLRFYAGVPLLSSEGVPLGALCVLDGKVRRDGLSPNQTTALGVLGKQVEAQLELRRSIKTLERQSKREVQLRQQFERCSHHDSLTGLPDRRLFRLKLEKALALRRRDQPSPALFLIDVDNLKVINKVSGHEAGDFVLTEIGWRLQEACGADAIVARVGSDEFAVLIGQCPSNAYAAEVAEVILDGVNLPFVHDGRAVNCVVSLGYVLASPKDGDFAALFSKADLALAQAKAAGRGCARGFSSTLARAHDHERGMLERARVALAENKVVPHYQPKVNLETGQLVGFEALLRIQVPDGHIALPETIAAAFEDRDLAIAITDRMIDCVVADIRKAVSRGIDIGHVAINTTSFDYSGRNFASQLLAKLWECSISPALVEVEVTESVALGRGRDHVRQALVALSDAGVRISLDDFGTGYASLTNVKQLPICALKIDRSFISGLGKVADDSIVHAMATLCTRMGLSIVAEGVETARQIEILRQFGVHYGQGLYFSHAVPSDDLGELTGISASGGWAPARICSLGEGLG